ncbi:MAG: hypothetical protein LBL66_09305 [Clostridiales bacterium]|nr:hypothetical protein [Clostridiales bacterium]
MSKSVFEKTPESGRFCVKCGGEVNGFELRCNRTLSFKEPTCEACMCKAYDISREYFRQSMEARFEITPCIGL